MTTRLRWLTLMLLVFAPVALCAVSGTTEGNRPESPTTHAQQQIDEIFDDIMVSLPPDVKAHLDTVKSSQAGKAAAEKAAEKPSGKETRPEVPHEDAGSSDAMRGLSDEVKRQVERTIKDIERRHKQRELQFKELQDNR